MELRIKKTLADHFRVGDNITFKTQRNGDIKGEIFSISQSTNEIFIQVRLTPPLTRLDESEFWSSDYGIDRKEYIGSIATEGIEPPRLESIQLIYKSSNGRYKNKTDGGLRITHIQFPKIPFKTGGKTRNRKNHTKHRKTNKRNKK